MESKYFYKPFQKGIADVPLPFEEIKKIADEKTQVHDLKTGWYWLPDFENKIIKKNAISSSSIFYN